MLVVTTRLVATLAVSVLVVGCSDVGDSPPTQPSAGSPSALADDAGPSASPTEAGSQELRPDLTTLRATGVVIRGQSRLRVLRFGTTLANIGAGPVVAVPDRTTSCPPGQRSFRQVVSLDADSDGQYHPRRDRETVEYDGACVLFHRTHDHWHIDGSARYSLRDLDGDEVVGVRKVSFCLRDSRKLPESARPPGARAASYHDCARNRSQGISPGWGDLYDRELDGQALALPQGLTDGRYCLRMTADPFDLFAESDERNNASMTALRITGRIVRVGGGWC